MLQETITSKAYKHFTFEEYLLLEEKAPYKSEYEKGRILAMSGGTLDHCTISQNTGTAIANALRNKGMICRVILRNNLYDKNNKTFLQIQ